MRVMDIFKGYCAASSSTRSACGADTSSMARKMRVIRAVHIVSLSLAELKGDIDDEREEGGNEEPAAHPDEAPC